MKHELPVEEMPGTTRAEAMAAVAQGVINIAEGYTTIEMNSRVYYGMAKVCFHEHEIIERLSDIHRRLSEVKYGTQAMEARSLLGDLIAWFEPVTP